MGLFGKKADTKSRHGDAQRVDEVRPPANRSPETARAIADHFEQLRQGNMDAPLTFRMIMSMTKGEREERERLLGISDGADVHKMT